MTTQSASPFDKPMLDCRECGNPLGKPYHHPRSRRCYFGAGPWWRRVGATMTVAFKDWTTAAAYAICDDDRCSWEHHDSLRLSTEAAGRHVEQTGHDVTVHLDSRRTVTRG